MTKGLKLKVRKFRGLISTFAEVAEEKLVGSGGLSAPPILNRVKHQNKLSTLSMRNLVYIYFRMLKIILKIINLLRQFAENQNLLEFSPITEVLFLHAEDENFYKFLQNRSFKICCELQTFYSKIDHLKTIFIKNS